MMDYKELIERLNSYSAEHQCHGGITAEATDAIETLLAERDAAVEELEQRPHHSTCKYGETCDYISVITGFPDCHGCDGWEWRGPHFAG